MYKADAGCQVPVTGYGWHAPHSTQNFSSPEGWVSLLYIIQSFWLPTIFVPLALLAAAPGSPLSPLSLPVSTLSSPTDPCLWLHLYISPTSLH